MLNKTIALTLPALTAAAFVGSAQAATITALGSENTTGGDWRTTTVAKSATFDPNGDNVYGNDGYYVGLITGGGGGTPTVLQSNPGYISSITASTPFYSDNSYALIDDPTQPSGAAVADVRSGLYYDAGTKFSFTVSADQEFVLAVVIGGLDGFNAPPDVTIDQTNGSGTATVSGLANVAPTYVFFNIDAAAGDTFNVDIAGTGTQGLTGIAFESVVPEPGSLALIALGGLCVLRRRRA